MSSNISAFFSQESEQDRKRRDEAFGKAPSERGNRKIEHPGNYVVKAGEFVWYDKRDPTHPIPTPSPEVKISRKGALLLNLSLQVCDKGTNLVPPGASIFHTITLSPVKGADEKKLENTYRFMKPQLTALFGSENIEIKEPWLLENCSIEFEEKAGKIVITKHHKLLKQVYITVDFKADQNNKPRLSVVQMNKLMPGDKSVTRKYTEEELARMNIADVNAPVETEVEVVPDDESSSQENVSETDTVDTSKLKRTEEDF
jgi:hypothetical protein